MHNPFSHKLTGKPKGSNSIIFVQRRMDQQSEIEKALLEPSKSTFQRIAPEIVINSREHIENEDFENGGETSSDGSDSMGDVPVKDYLTAPRIERNRILDKKGSK